MIKEKIVKIKNYDELIKLFKYADKIGNKWASGRSLSDKRLSETAYKSYKNEDLCIMFDKEGRAEYSPYDFYKDYSETSHFQFLNVCDVVKEVEFNF